MLTKEVEGQLLLELIDHFAAEHVLSFSWGGAATLVALAHRPRRVEKAVISSFSPVINAHMLDYLERGVDYLGQRDGDRVGHLVNSTIGKHLPSLFKRFNHKHVSTLDEHEYRQMYAHIKQVLNMEAHCGKECLQAIDIPLIFVNGERDEYTSVEDACLFAQHIDHAQFAVINDAGHFLDMEHKAAWLQTRDTLLGYLQQPLSNRQRSLIMPESAALAG